MANEFYRWHEIWNARQSDENVSLNLDTLISLNGFDSGAGKINQIDWLENARCLADLIGIQDGDSVFEFGCGSGAFLYALEKYKAITGGGVDYSFPLIEVARQILPSMQFIHAEAKHTPMHPYYDHTISHSMFHYFEPSYAQRVLEKMALKSLKTIAILEIPDAATREESEQLRRSLLSKNEDYDKKYAGLSHYYYDQSWFIERAGSLGLQCEFIKNTIPNYSQSRFRYGCLMRKNN